MKSFQMLATFFAGVALLGFPAAAVEVLPAKEIADALMVKVEELSGADAEQGKRARALKALAIRVSRIEEGSLPVDWAGKDGSTTLMLAAALDEAPAVRYLLRQGASLECRNAKGKNALDLAKSFGVRAILRRGGPEKGVVVLDIGHCIGSEGAIMPAAVNGKCFSETVFWYQYAPEIKRVIEEAGYTCTICNRGFMPEDETLRGYAQQGDVIHLCCPDLDAGRRVSRYHKDRVASGMVSADYAVWRKATCAVFLHHNSTSRRWLKGKITSIVLHNRYNGQPLAEAIARRMEKDVFGRGFSVGGECKIVSCYEDAARGAGWLNTCDDSGIPAVILEVAYLNHLQHVTYLTDDANARHFAESVGQGVLDYLRHNRNTPRHVREDENQPDEGSFGHAPESRKLVIPGAKMLVP